MTIEDVACPSTNGDDGPSTNGDDGVPPRMAMTGTVPRRQLADFDGLAAGHRPDDEKRLGACRDRGGQPRVEGLVRQILFARKKSDERPALLRAVIADRAPQGGVLRLEGIEYRAKRGLTVHSNRHLVADTGQGLQMGWEYDADHGSVWTSTDTTGGKSRTTADQSSPLLADAYT